MTSPRQPRKIFSTIVKVGGLLLVAAAALVTLASQQQQPLRKVGITPQHPERRPVTSPQVARTEFMTYAIGYGLALALTAAAFGLVRLQLLTGQAAFYAVLGLGFVQMLVHFRCFLHIDLKRSARADLQLLLFSAMIVSLMVGGTLVVLFNLHSRMMGP